MATDAVPPWGADDRRRYERLGEALLSDNGRIAGPLQAKGIAVEALARRMRSSTPELVLAATGLDVGSDLSGRLGDGRYVLVAHYERIPWAGADLLHEDELRSELYRSHARRAVRMDTEEAEGLVRQIAISELMDAWSYGSNNNTRAMALQEITREEFGVRGDVRTDRRMRQSVDMELRYNRQALTDFLRTQHTITQEHLQARGITELVAYRASSWSAEAERPQWATENRIGTRVDVPRRPLAGWSTDRQLVADRLKRRRGRGVILAARYSAEDIVSLPMTGMGFRGSQELVTLPGDGHVVLDGVVEEPRIGERVVEVGRGGPAVGDGVAVEGGEEAAGAAWHPHFVAGRLTAPDALDVRIGRILDGREEAPSWWPRDDSGYAIRGRDLDFLGIDPQHLRWMITGQSPMGLTPRLYKQFAGEMRDALEQDRIEAAQVDIRLKGTAAEFFSGPRKTLPTPAELSGNPEALARMREWFGDDEHRPLRRPFDAMYRLGLEPEPSDYDLDINSTAAVRAARAYWRDHYHDRYPGDFMGGHGFLDKQAVRGALPHLADWATRWEDRLNRPLSLGVFESTGPFDEEALGRKLSAHFKDSDWIIHRYQQSVGPLPRTERVASAARPDHLRRAIGNEHRSGRVGGRG